MLDKIKKWLLHVQCLQKSFFSSDLIWILMSRNVSSNIHGWAPSNSQYIGLKDKFTNNCLLVKEREVERKWKLFRLLSYDGTSITTHIYRPHILYAHCLLVCGHIYIHTYTYLVTYETIYQICNMIHGIIHKSAFVLMAIYH